MKFILETERLFLREFMLSDNVHLFNLNNDSEVLKYTGDIPFVSIKEATKFIDNYSEYQISGFGRWAVCLKKTNEFIGWCGLKKDTKTGEIDLGFRFLKNKWGKGYATEASLGCIKYGFVILNLSKLVGRTYLENKYSQNVLKKCKFSLSKKIMYDNRLALQFELKNDQN